MNNPTPYKRITHTEQPVFDPATGFCWFFHNGWGEDDGVWCHLDKDGYRLNLAANHSYTHWHPDQPSAPTCVPTEGEPDLHKRMIEALRNCGTPTPPKSAQQPPLSPGILREIVAEALSSAPLGGKTALEAVMVAITPYLAHSFVASVSPGSGEALREALERCWNKILDSIEVSGDEVEVRLDAPKLLLAAITPFLAQPAQPKAAPQQEVDMELEPETAIDTSQRLTCVCGAPKAPGVHRKDGPKMRTSGIWGGVHLASRSRLWIIAITRARRDSY